MARHFSLLCLRFRDSLNWLVPMPVVSPNKPYRVGKSRTGLGLFATKPIKKGKKIIRYKGPLIDNDEAEKLDNKYLFEVSKKWTINGAARSNIARYGNHSCKPNAESDVSAKKRRVVIRAIRDIEPGEEITYDYGEDYFKVFLKPHGCKCDHCEKKRLKKAAKKAEKKAEKKAAKAKTKSVGKASPKKNAAKPVEAKAKTRATTKAKTKATGAATKAVQARKPKSAKAPSAAGRDLRRAASKAKNRQRALGPASAAKSGASVTFG